MHEITKAKLEADYLNEDEVLKWPCPSCSHDFMTNSPEAVFSQPSTQIKQYPYELRTTGEIKEFNIKPGPKTFFSVNVICECCGEPAVLHGLISEDLDLAKKKLEGIEEFKKLYNVEGISLSLLPIHVITGTPILIHDLIKSAARHMFGDVPACANYLRKAVEAVMDDQKIPTKRTLHSRIEKFSESFPEEGEFLMSVKWIGNDGSHIAEGLNRSDILEAFEALEEVFSSLYNQRRKKRLARAKSRNTKKLKA